MLHLPGWGTKSVSAPATPVVTTAINSPPRRKRSSRSESSLIATNLFLLRILFGRLFGRLFLNAFSAFARLVIVGAAHVVTAAFANQLAPAFVQARAANRT